MSEAHLRPYLDQSGLDRWYRCLARDRQLLGSAPQQHVGARHRRRSRSHSAGPHLDHAPPTAWHLRVHVLPPRAGRQAALRTRHEEAVHGERRHRRVAAEGRRRGDRGRQEHEGQPRRRGSKDARVAQRWHRAARVQPRNAEPGKSVADAQKWFQSGFKGTAPVKLLGAMQSIPQGTSVYLTATFEAGRKYVLSDEEHHLQTTFTPS